MSQDPQLVRIDDGGNLDPGFEPRPELGDDIFGRVVAPLRDGNILLAVGDSLTRLRSNGAPDRRFGSRGRAHLGRYVTHFTPTALTVASDDRILVAGYGNDGSRFFPAVLRIIP